MENKDYRLNAPDNFTQLDDAITKDLNEIADLAAKICKAPVALVTLLHGDKPCFKASYGIAIKCTPDDISFCNYDIKDGKLLIVEDTTIDGRFNTNPMFTGDPKVRFYAGIKLVRQDGFAIGSLCVLDFEPRTLNEHQQTSLNVLSRQVVNMMELHFSLQSLEQQQQKASAQNFSIEQSEIKLKAIFDSAKDTHILVGTKLEVLAFNKSAAVFARTVYQKKLAIGDDIMTYTDPLLSSQFARNFAYALSGRSVKREWMLMPGTEQACWKETSFIPVKNNKGVVIGVALNSTDITTRKQQEKQISIQNEALTRIAIIQSHELRRPVASLLGIIDLMKMEQIHFDYFTMLEQTVNELDEKIRGIVKESEETIQSREMKIVA